MSLAITHFATGAALALLISHWASIEDHDALVMVLGGIWAMVPDLEKIHADGVLSALHDSVLANVFAFHRALDVGDPGDSITMGIKAVAVLLVAVAIVMCQEDSESFKY